MESNFLRNIVKLLSRALFPNHSHARKALKNDEGFNQLISQLIEEDALWLKIFEKLSKLRDDANKFYQTRGEKEKISHQIGELTLQYPEGKHILEAYPDINNYITDDISVEELKDKRRKVFQVLSDLYQKK